MGLFMSAAERKRENRRRRRRAIREVMNAVEDTRMKCDDLRKARDAAWESARAALREKREADLQRQLAAVQANDATLATAVAAKASPSVVTLSVNWTVWIRTPRWRNRPSCCRSFLPCHCRMRWMLPIRPFRWRR